MINIDWSYAPPGAEHFHKGDILYSPHWRKSGFYCDLGLEAFGWIKDTYPSPINECIERPQPKPWSGPEDGLPPVGTEVEFKVSSGKWWKSRVFAVKYNIDESADVLIDHQEGWAFVDSNSHRLRPIKTPAQLRETAIRELMDIAQVDCRVTAARLVDAGFKREVK